jgi:gas vesicle protein
MWKARGAKPRPIGERSMPEPVPVQAEGREEEGTNLFAWFLTGAFIGAVVTVLYSPRSGKENRQFIAEKAQQSKEAISDSARDMVDTSREMFERGRKLVEDAAELFDRGRKLVRGDGPEDV